MKKLLVLLIIVSASMSLGYTQEITAPQSGTIIEPGSTISVMSSSNDTVFFEFGGHKPDGNSDWFIGSANLLVPTFGAPEFARINTTASDSSHLHGWMSSDRAMPDLLFENINNVEKISTLWFITGSHDTVFHYPSNLEEGISVYITADPSDLYDTDIGILVDGSGNLIPDSIANSRGYDEYGVVSFTTQTWVPEVNIYVPEPMSANIPNIYLVSSGADSLVFQGPFLVCDSFECITVYEMILDTVTNLGEGTFLFEADTITESIDILSVINTGDTTEIVFLFSGYESVNDSSEAHIVNDSNEVHISNFAAAGSEYFDWYPELDRGKIEKSAQISIIDNGTLVYDDVVKIKSFGGSSSLAPAKNLRLKFPSYNRLNYPVVSPNEEKIMDLRKSGWSEAPVSNAMGNFILNEENVGVPAGLFTRVYLNGEYHGQYNLKEVSGQHFAEELFPSIDDNDFAFYTASDWNTFNMQERADAGDCHRDSVAIRMERFDEDYAWLINADKQDPMFRNLLKQRFNYESLFKVKFLSAFCERGDYGPHNTEFFSDNSGTLPYYWLSKDFDRSFTCWELFNDGFTQQLFDLSDSSDIMQTNLMLNMMESDSLQFDFQNLASDMGNTTLLPENLLGKWSSLTQSHYLYVDQNFARWGMLPYSEVNASDFFYIDQCAQEFLANRTGLMYGFLNEHFQSDTTLVRFRSVTECGEATAFVSRMEAADSVWVHRTSFTGIPVPLKAEGYDFQYWVINTDTVFEESFFKTFHPDTVYNVTAMFGCLEIDENISEIRISEVLPDNETVVADPQGDYEDYIELVNSSGDVINLAGLYLSDDLSNLQKFRFTDDFNLGTGQFVLFWADKDTLDGAFHANFKLSKDGESVYLSDGINLIDSISWDFTIPEDSSYGRCPTGELSVMAPTPNLPNQCQTIGIEEVEGVPAVYDNIVIYDLLGRVLSRNVDYPSGVYIRTFSLKGEILFSEGFVIQR